MTPPTPMHAYSSTPAAARIVIEEPAPKPHAYAARVEALREQGHTYISAMQAIERSEQRGAGRLPIKMNTDTCGGRGNKRPHQTEPLTTRILAHLSADQWQPVNDEFAVAVKATRNSINEALRKMRAQGRVKYLSQAGKKKSLWRLA